MLAPSLHGDNNQGQREDTEVSPEEAAALYSLFLLLYISDYITPSQDYQAIYSHFYGILYGKWLFLK